MLDTAAVRRELAAELNHARNETDRLFRLIDPEAIYNRPIAERHRLIFYLGHLEAFDWNLLARRGSGESEFHAEFDRLFERGIDPEPGQAESDAPSDWPARDEVDRYNARTRAWIDAHFDSLDPELIQMAIEHRHMHAETLAYLMHGLPYEKKESDGAPVSLPERQTPPNPMIEISEEAVTLGSPVAEGFAWDNERQAHEVFVPAFSISKFKISNGEYLAFVRSGGPAPHFWVERNGQWFYRGMFAELPLPLDWPVWVTWDQAAAYAQWRGMKLPSEAQHQLASRKSKPDPWRDNYGFRRWDPVPVDFGHEKTNGAAPVQTTGNGWEWTHDVFAPFAGFRPHPFYAGYSADFFDGRHYVMKGASPRTATLLTRPGFRNWFRPDYPHMYAGFRLVDRR